MVNLKDTTIVIPIRIDSPERKRNLDAALKWLCEQTDASIWVLEADKVKQCDLKEGTDRVCYIFEKDTERIFYRTYYLNKLIKMVQTPIVGIWDADIIIPVEQMEKAVTTIRRGVAAIAYPFDGTFRLLGNEISDRFNEKPDISILFNEVKEYPPYTDRPSFGGAFFVNKAIYLQAGGENENFFGWGPEDMERVIRMEIVGYPPYRVTGSLFHLWHPISGSSGINNYTQQKKNKKELVKVSGMYKPELEAYISTWDHKTNTVYVSLICRIGNLLFQIAVAASLAKKHNCKLVAILSDYWAPEPDNCYLSEYIKPFQENILRKISFSDEQPERYKLYIEPYFHYSPIPFRDGIFLHGLFQSEKHFDKAYIRELFSIDAETEKYINETYGFITEGNITSINVRRGDYLQQQESHPVCNLDYFFRAIERIGSKERFLICSDDIAWCKENFKGENFFFVEHVSPVIDLYVQTMCSNNIISNSTFSWWGAWLNPNPDKLVIAPQRWFGPKKEYLQTHDLLPDEWIRL